jgi:hypothetical protein
MSFSINCSESKMSSSSAAHCWCDVLVNGVCTLDSSGDGIDDGAEFDDTNELGEPGEAGDVDDMEPGGELDAVVERASVSSKHSRNVR